jgi:hypothetical protein
MPAGSAILDGPVMGIRDSDPVVNRSLIGMAALTEGTCGIGQLDDFC